ncbi:hypothetical protein ES703_02120 [subsurface metagenome]
MRPAIFRVRKYDAKMDPEAIRLRFAAQRDSMVEQVEAKFAELTEVERKAKRVIEAAGISVNLIPSYLNFARQCYRLSQQFSGVTQTNEVYYRYITWISRGLTSAVLRDISELCGVDIATYLGI